MGVGISLILNRLIHHKIIMMSYQYTHILNMSEEQSNLHSKLLGIYNLHARKCFSTTKLCHHSSGVVNSFLDFA